MLLDKYYGSNEKSTSNTTKNTTNNRILQYFPIKETNEISNNSHIQTYIENIDDTYLDTKNLVIQMDKCPLCNSKMNIKHSKSDIIFFV